jgi:hypothetical protein
MSTFPEASAIVSVASQFMLSIVAPEKLREQLGVALRYYRFFGDLAGFEDFGFFGDLAGFDFTLTFARILDNVASCFALLLAASFAMRLFMSASSFRSETTWFSNLLAPAS